jgi:hypothetical protein
VNRGYCRPERIFPWNFNTVDRTPLPPELLEKIDKSGISDSYVQSSAQSIFDDTDTIGFLAFVAVLAIIFIAGKISDSRHAPPAKDYLR